jgi:uncharacterized protein (TIGR01319 family)
MKKGVVMKTIQTILITDVGSTTTKALLIQKQAQSFAIIGLQNAATTVEKPLEDVTIGVMNAIIAMEQKTKRKLLKSKKVGKALDFVPETCYITTSSAGGGLQILVIGLTKFDTASSAERAAFGAGGVILDTFAIDDKRSALEQMEAMKNLQPDIILMAGGVEDGAVVPVLRLAEILQIAEPKAKFSSSDKIPFIFAGNTKVRPYLENLIQHKFEWFPVANIRPTMQYEDLKEAQEKIHELFMNNVMERAPGYPFLKHSVADKIIPTPLGVMQTLKILNESSQKNVLMVDIGGATTDIFSNIFGQFFRTVSANYGMSYSISNVLKEAGIKSLQQWIAPNIETAYIQNYIANKMLYPIYNPVSETEFMIEQAVGREAIRMSKEQHFAMNFNTKQIGFLEKLKKNDIEKIVEAFYYEKKLEQEQFFLHDFDVLIGAGGLLSHTKNKMQALSVVMEGFQLEGMTEIWRDKYFISPHLGKLSEIDKELAQKLIMEQCFEILGMVIRPVTKKWKDNMPLLNYKIFKNSALIKENELKVGALCCEHNPNNENLEIRITLAKGVYLTSDERSEHVFKTTDSIIFDGRTKIDFLQMNQELKLYTLSELSVPSEETFIKMQKNPHIIKGNHHKKMELPYQGEIHVKPEEVVNPDSVIGENRYAPPKLFFLSLFDKSYLDLNSENLRDFLTIKEGDEINFGTKIIDSNSYSLKNEFKGIFRRYESPVRGIVEKIHYEAGTILIKEIQDYSNKPVTIKISDILHVAPEDIQRYIKRKEGDFIYGGELLASRMYNMKDGQDRTSLTDATYMQSVISDAQSQTQKIPVTIPSPTTGTIKKIDTKTGQVVIHYDKKPYIKRAFLHGKIREIETGKAAVLEFEGIITQGIIGFGKEAGGMLQIIKESEQMEQIEKGNIVIFERKITNAELQKLAVQKVNGVIAGSIDYDELRQFIGNDIGVALTGNENIPFPFIITEGFGNFVMNKELLTLFNEHKDNWCYLNGHTQIRAGVIRPEIILQKI